GDSRNGFGPSQNASGPSRNGFGSSQNVGRSSRNDFRTPETALGPPKMLLGVPKTVSGGPKTPSGGLKTPKKWQKWRKRTGNAENEGKGGKISGKNLSTWCLSTNNHNVEPVVLFGDKKDGIKALRVAPKVHDSQLSVTAWAKPAESPEVKAERANSRAFGFSI